MIVVIDMDRWKDPVVLGGEVMLTVQGTGDKVFAIVTKVNNEARQFACKVVRPHTMTKEQFIAWQRGD